MKPRSRTQIYEDKTFFGDYLDSTSEKDYFADAFAAKAGKASIQSLLDLGCFDGSLTRKIVERLAAQNCCPGAVTCVEPAALPLREFEVNARAAHRGINWRFVNRSMEEFLSENCETFDWIIASHSLYWIGNNSDIVPALVRSGRNTAIVIRDGGVLHQVEMKYRPLMTKKTKRFISSDEIGEILRSAGIAYEIMGFRASMKVPEATTKEFAALAGFLLDLTLEELDPALFPGLYADLNVNNGRSTYGIDVIWCGEIIK